MRKQIVWLSALVVMAAFGCGRRAAEKPSSASPRQTAAVPLPKWAPKNPSPEFLRAAGVLKPMPPELLQEMLQRAGHPDVVMQIVVMFWPAAWEFFGTLSDEQVERFRTTGRIDLLMGDLTKEQRRALDRFIASYDKAREGDTLVNFFKRGANKDLSNVLVGFQREEHIVALRFLIRNLRTGEDSQIDFVPFAVI